MQEISIGNAPRRKLDGAFLRAHVSRTMGEVVISKTFMKYLQEMKSLIGAVSGQWDKYKRYTNPYEFIHTQHPVGRTPICTVVPLSRSYFKLVEIAHRYSIIPVELDVQIKTFSFAEGPGGFVQAIAHSRQNPADQYYGMTLDCNNHSSIPGWKKTAGFMQETPSFKIYRGATGDGNLLHPANLMHCYNSHANSCHLVTADGGFDFTQDFASQETTSLPLAYAQIAFALAVQRVGGTFVLKLFDTSTAASLDLLFILWSAYSSLDICKPTTSRPANSERYIVCRGFRAALSHDAVVAMANTLRKINEGWKPRRLQSSDLPYSFITSLQEANAMFGQAQIESIAATLNLISNPTTEKIDALVKSNTGRCIRWCTKHALPSCKPHNKPRRLNAS